MNVFNNRRGKAVAKAEVNDLTVDNFRSALRDRNIFAAPIVGSAIYIFNDIYLNDVSKPPVAPNSKELIRLAAAAGVAAISGFAFASFAQKAQDIAKNLESRVRTETHRLMLAIKTRNVFAVPLVGASLYILNDIYLNDFRKPPAFPSPKELVGLAAAAGVAAISGFGFASFAQKAENAEKDLKSRLGN